MILQAADAVLGRERFRTAAEDDDGDRLAFGDFGAQLAHPIEAERGRRLQHELRHPVGGARAGRKPEQDDADEDQRTSPGRAAAAAGARRSASATGRGPAAAAARRCTGFHDSIPSMTKRLFTASCCVATRVRGRDCAQGAAICAAADRLRARGARAPRRRLRAGSEGGRAGATCAPARTPRLGMQAIAAPVRRARRPQHEAGAVARGVGDQHGARGDHLALRRGPGADPRIERAAARNRRPIRRR